METYSAGSVADEKKNKFKSYYVVWKLSSAIQSHEATESLNRTM